MSTRRAEWMVGASLASLLLACGGSQAPAYAVRGEDPAAGADAKIFVSQRAPNYEVRLDVDHLIPPGRVEAGAQHYAVWIQPPDRDPVHAANLRYDPQNRSGEARLITPYQYFDLVVTAETSPLPEQPSDADVLSQQVVTSQR